MRVRTERQRRILKMVKEHGVLNAHQICRLLNQRLKDEYRWCFYTFKEKPLGTTNMPCRGIVEKKCKIKPSSVRGSLKGLKLGSEKLRFTDKGGIGTDIFRFFYLDPKIFEKQVLRYTLIPYTRKKKQTTFNDFGRLV